MRPRALLREVVVDIVSGTARAGVFLVMFSLLIGCSVVGEALNTRQLVVDAQQFRSSGAAIIVLTAAGAVDPMACERLDSVAGVESAGALRESGAAAIATLLPASPIPIHEVSQQFEAVLGARRLSGSGAVVSDEVIESLGGRGISWFATRAGALHVGSVYSYPTDGRRAGLAWAVLLPTTSRDPFDECWISVWPYDESMRQLLPSAIDIDAAARSGSAFTYDVAQLNERLGSAPSGSQRFGNRVTASAPLVVAVAGLLLGALSIFLRRLEIAARLHHRSRRTTIVEFVLLETSFWAILGGGIASMGGLVIAISLLPEDGRAIALMTALMTGIGILSSVFGAVGATLFVRERQLFVYFTER